MDQSNSLKITLKIILSIFLTAIIITGGLYLWDRYYRSQEPILQPEKEVHFEELKTFTGEKIKLSFKYPVDWGEAKEEIGYISENIPSQGETYYLSFTKNPYLAFSGASKNSQIDGIGGPCPIRGFFDGTSERGALTCAECQKEEGENSCLNCQEITIDGQKGISFLYVPDENCTLMGFQRVIYLLAPEKSSSEFPGLVLTLNLVTADDAMMHDYADRASSLSGEDEENEQGRKNLLSQFRELLQKHKNEILAEEINDYLTELQIKEFDNFIADIKFIE